jgi:N-methylhydantoinase B/oxoprolinase/acetone carboxylase alpha subunit
MPRGTVLSIRTPGGGGYGHAMARDPQSVAKDRREDRTSYTGTARGQKGDAA